MNICNKWKEFKGISEIFASVIVKNRSNITIFRLFWFLASMKKFTRNLKNFKSEFLSSYQLIFVEKI